MSKFRRYRSLFSSKVSQGSEGVFSSVRSRVVPVLWAAFKKTCFALGFMVFLSGLYMAYAVANFQQASAPPVLPSEMVLHLKLDGEVKETPPQAGFVNPFDPVPPTLRQIVRTIDAAAEDDRVKGLYVRLKGARMTLSQVQEIRAAVKRLKETGKFTKIYSSSYGGATGGLGRIYLASAFDERWMQPLGVVSMDGLRAEVPFFRAVLDKVGVEPNFYQREEYKTAYESFTNSQMSPANRTVLKDVVASVRGAVMLDMPADLDLDAKGLQALIDKGLLTAPEALEAGLITHSDYVDVLVDGLKGDLLGDADSEEALFVPFGSYAADVARGRRSSMGKKRPIVALVYAVGAIMDSNESGKSGIASAAKIAPAILDAADDDSVKAIVLRIDSPGGSPVASESILRAVNKAKQKGKPVIVSMGSVAASGGYWIASSADRIFAMPTTLTGSIGVVGGKVSAAQMWDKIGVSWDRSIQWGDNAGIWSLNETFTAGQEDRVQAMLTQVYSAFLERVADGRGMSLEAADDVARGRVWPGARAVENGLVDELGGLQDTLAYVAGLLDVDAPDDLRLVVMPRPLSTLERLLDLLSQQSLVFEGLRLQGRIMTALEPYAQRFQTMSALSQNGTAAVYYDGGFAR